MFIIPRNEHGIVNRAKNSIFCYQGWPSVCRDENGVLYAVSSSFRCGHVCPFGKTAMYISRDGGKTWCPPVVINDTYLDDRDAGILYLGGGHMLVTWFELPAAYYEKNLSNILPGCNEGSAGVVKAMIESYSGIPHSYPNGGSYIRISENYGVTWSDPIRVPVTAPHGPIKGKDGTLYYLGKEMDSYITDREDELNAIAMYISQDSGRTWSKQGVCGKPDGTIWESFHEPHVIELPGGGLFGMIRGEGERVYRGFTMYTTVSHDRGRTWSEWIPLNIEGSPPHLMLHSSGALVCTFGRREEPFGEHALVSYDQGKTWDKEYVIDNRPNDGDLGYPASVELDDGSILSVYYQKYPGDAYNSILYTKWYLDD